MHQVLIDAYIAYRLRTGRGPSHSVAVNGVSTLLLECSSFLDSNAEMDASRLPVHVLLSLSGAVSTRFSMLLARSVRK